MLLSVHLQPFSYKPETVRVLPADGILRRAVHAAVNTLVRTENTPRSNAATSDVCRMPLQPRMSAEHLRLLKRTDSPSWSTNPFGQTQAHGKYDLEKHDLEEQQLDDASASHCGPSPSRTVTSILHPSRQPRRTASAYMRSLPKRKFNRYFTVILASGLVIFIVILTQLGHNSQHGIDGWIDQQPAIPVWEEFPFLKRYHGGIRTLVPLAENIPEYPTDPVDAVEITKDSMTAADAQLHTRQSRYSLPRYRVFDPFRNSSDNIPPIQECFLDDKSTIRIPKLRAFSGRPTGFPEHVMGSYDLLGLDNDPCFDRFGRLGPYGFGYARKYGGTGAGMDGDTDGAQEVWVDDEQVDFRNIRWAEAQARCATKNSHRFRNATTDYGALQPRDVSSIVDHIPPANIADSYSPVEVQSDSYATSLLRTAIIVRTWHDYPWDPSDILNMRSVISELSLASGTEYTIHFLIHVRDGDLQIWSDAATHARVLAESLPPEFAGMGTLWSERQMSLVYGGVQDINYRGLGVFGAYLSTFMPVQHFAVTHPEYSYFWQWELDSRYTGHHYHLLSKVSAWARGQPRKGLWERNARFYVPQEYGTWDDFRQMVRVQTEHGTSAKTNLYTFDAIGDAEENPAAASRKAEKPIWGPEPPAWNNMENDTDPVPPTTMEKDKYSWGVGEEADLITFNPLFDPAGTNWILADDVTGYNSTSGMPPRRTAIITFSRLSARLLRLMHRETALHRRHMFSEMWPATCALHHGLKAVYAPHPVFIDRAWPTDYLAAIFNGGRNGASGGARASVFSDERQHNFRGTSWYYNAGAPENLWRRWLGYRVNGDGGQEWEMANEGRMCLPAMLLHPVKQANLIYEHRHGEK